jgi:heat shock protein HtpX
MKRVALFLLTNLAVMLVIGVIFSVFGLGRMEGPNGFNLGGVLAMSAVIGFTGSFISLLISKPMAKWSTGAQVITQARSQDEQWLLDSVKRLSDTAGIGMPEVAIYEGEANAFATGAFKNSALVAVSTGLLQSMTKEEVEAVLAHEVAHIANGDMVTLTLIQGVVNTFVVFLSRVIGYVVDKQLNKDGNGQGDLAGLPIGIWDLGFSDRRLVLTSARIPSRRRCCQVHGPAGFNDQSLEPPRWR